MAIEIMVGMMAFILVLCFLTDLLILGWKFSVVSQVNSYVTRTAGIQGGILSSAPHGFPGGNDAYINTYEMRAKIDSYFSGAGVEPDEYTVRVNGRDIMTSTNTHQIDYREPVETHITLEYKWDLMSNFIPGEFSQTINSKRSAVSEFKYRYDSWVGE